MLSQYAVYYNVPIYIKVIMHSQFRESKLIYDI